jgi:SOS response regulatory protein OraA/RecX
VTNPESTANAPDPELVNRLGLKRASDLEAPEAEPARLPWNEAEAEAQGTRAKGGAGRGQRKPRVRDLAQRQREVADAEAEERSLAGDQRRRRVQRSKPLPKAGPKASGSRSASKGGGSKLVGVRTPSKPEPEPEIPDWADAGEAPSWAVDGDLPQRVSDLISTWEQQVERDDQDERDRAAAERIAAGEDVGPEASEPKQLEPLSDDEALHLARAVGLRLLNAQPRTRHELRLKMAQRDVPLMAIEQALDEFEKYRYLDDAAFARAWVESRVRSKGFARGRLSQELRSKGLDQELIEDALSQIEPEDEKDRCEEMALKKLGHRTLPPSGPSQEDRKERDKVLRRVVGFLARKGFNQGMALSCARRAMDRHDAGER